MSKLSVHDFISQSVSNAANQTMSVCLPLVQQSFSQAEKQSVSQTIHLYLPAISQAAS